VAGKGGEGLTRGGGGTSRSRDRVGGRELRQEPVIRGNQMKRKDAKRIGVVGGRAGNSV